MSKNQPGTHRTTLSHAHKQPDLRKANPLYDKAPPITPVFENERDPYHARQLHDQGKTEAQRRESFMVKRQQPKPVLKPSPTLSRGSDSAAFNAQWAQEQKNARNFRRERNTHTSSTHTIRKTQHER